MAFTLAAALYILALLLTAVLIFFVIYQIIAFDELKTDYKNPIDQCHSLNPLVLPEYFIHGGFTFLFLIAGEFLTVLLNIPLLAYHANRYMNRPVMTGPGIYDPTTIMNADVLSRGLKEGWIKLAFYIISFFYYLYRMTLNCYLRQDGHSALKTCHIAMSVTFFAGLLDETRLPLFTGNNGDKAESL